MHIETEYLFLFFWIALLHVFSPFFVERKDSGFGHRLTEYTVEEVPKVYFDIQRLRRVKTRRVWTWPRVLLHSYEVLRMIDYSEEAAYTLFGSIFRLLNIKYLWDYQGVRFGVVRNNFLQFLNAKTGDFTLLSRSIC